MVAQANMDRESFAASRSAQGQTRSDADRYGPFGSLDRIDAKATLRRAVFVKGNSILTGAPLNAKAILVRRVGEETR